MTMTTPDFRDFYYKNVFKTAPALLHQCKPSAFIKNSLVWVYKKDDTTLQVYFRIIKIREKDKPDRLFPALWHIKLDFLGYGEPGSRSIVRGYATEKEYDYVYDDIKPHPERLILYNNYREQISSLDFKDLWPGCTHGETHPPVTCLHGICESCDCSECDLKI